MKRVAPKLALTENDVFYDLSSGLVRLVIYLYLATPVRKSVCIEAISRKHDIAQGAQETVKLTGFSNPNRELTFIHDDVRMVDFTDAMVVYLAFARFSSSLMEELCYKFEQMKPGLRIISPKIIIGHPRIAYMDDTDLPMTWEEKEVSHYELMEPA